MLDYPSEVRARCSPHLIEQAVINLVDNALKYSEVGAQVEVRGGLENQEALIQVRDTGCGIGQEHLGRVFERFYRVDKARSRNAGGTGLGLSIVKHIMLLHQGRTEVQSQLGKGSVFTLRWPSAAAEAVSRSQPSETR
jgi:two-component system phosphate regulon sensor histidine kinase PhoR